MASYFVPSIEMILQIVAPPVVFGGVTFVILQHTPLKQQMSYDTREFVFKAAVGLGALSTIAYMIPKDPGF